VTKSSAEPFDDVTLPKERIAETAAMNHDPRPHVRRRRHAIDRLRALTTGAAVAGLAGTAGFGLLAAASWSGTATAADTSGGSTTFGSSGSDGGSGTNGSAGGSGTSGTSGSTRATAAPNTGGTAARPAATPRVQRANGSGHASTGGSH
jgi:hypothetical protein